MLLLYDVCRRLHIICPVNFIYARDDGSAVKVAFTEEGEVCRIWLKLKLDDLRKRFEYPCFLYSRDSWLINLNHVRKVYSHQLITDDGTSFPLNSEQVSEISEILRQDPVRFRDVDRVGRKW